MLKEKVPLLNADKRRQNNYAARWLFTGLAVLGAIGVVDGGVKAGQKYYDDIEASGKAPVLTHDQLKDLTKVYVVKPDETVWGIATAEGPAIADNPQSMSNAEDQIIAQLPNKNIDLMYPGEEIRLPADSRIGTPIKKDQSTS